MTMFIFQQIDYKTTNKTHIPFADVDAKALSAYFNQARQTWPNTNCNFFFLQEL